MAAIEIGWWVPYVVEFFGTFLFQVFGGSTAATMDAVFNGVVLTVIIFMTAKASGGVVNPSVALMLFIVGEISWIKAAGFALVQISGAACGALVASVIDIGYTYGSWDVNHAGPGCGPVAVDARHYAPIFVWEFLGTFVLNSTICATAVSKPGFGNIAPIAIGASIFVSVAAGGGFSGGFFKRVQATSNSPHYPATTLRVSRVLCGRSRLARSPRHCATPQ